jgi:hypothetical protein
MSKEEKDFSYLIRNNPKKALSGKKLYELPRIIKIKSTLYRP